MVTRPGHALRIPGDVSSTSPGRVRPGRRCTEVRDTNSFILCDDLPLATRNEAVRVRARAILRPHRSGSHAFFVRGSGRSKILIDDHEVAALPAQAESYDIMAALFSDALGKGYVRLRAGKPVRIAIEMVCQPGLYHVLRFGCRPPEPPDLLDRAIAAARAADVVVLMVGTNRDIETESQDRDTTSLPGPQDELVERVLDANPSTAIIVNAGRAIDLPWASKASTILYSWLPGHAYGPALAAVLAGDLEPGGRLPITIAAAPGRLPSVRHGPG